MRVIKEKEFSLNNIQYIARVFIPEGKTTHYGEIVYKNNGQRPENKMKDIVRQYLMQFNVEISADSNVMTTHKAVRLLMRYI